MRFFFRILLLLMFSLMPIISSAQTYFGNHYYIETDAPFTFSNNHLIWDVDQTITSNTNFGDTYSFSVFADSGYLIDLSTTISGSYQFTSTMPPFPGYASITLRFFNGTDSIRYSVDNSVNQSGITDFTTPHSEGPQASFIGNLLYGVVLIDGQGATSEFNLDSITINFLVVEVPEPSSYVMLSLGIGAISFATRRRRK